MRPAEILDELGSVLGSVEDTSLDALADVIGRASRVVCAGQGRSGLIAAALAVRLGHLGVDARVAGEASQPPVGPGDLLVAFSRSGATAVTLHQVARARRAGAAVAAITMKRASPLDLGANVCVIVPETTSRQHGGSLFEQTALVLADAVAAALQSSRGLSHDDLSARHDNLQ